jgi:hypothetical protein
MQKVKLNISNHAINYLVKVMPVVYAVFNLDNAHVLAMIESIAKELLIELQIKAIKADKTHKLKIKPYQAYVLISCIHVIDNMNESTHEGHFPPDIMTELYGILDSMHQQLI